MEGRKEGLDYSSRKANKSTQASSKQLGIEEFTLHRPWASFVSSDEFLAFDLVIRQEDTLRGERRREREKILQFLLLLLTSFSDARDWVTQWYVKKETHFLATLPAQAAACCITQSQRDKNSLSKSPIDQSIDRLHNNQPVREFVPNSPTWFQLQ